MKYSIVIPTYNHLEDALLPCVETLIKYTNTLDDEKEFVFVCNGCTDGTYEYLDSVKDKFKNLVILKYDKALGCTKACNEGYKHSKGDFIVELNNDTTLNPQKTDKWLEILNEPFVNNPCMGITGIHSLRCDYSDREFLLFFCVMIRKEVFRDVGYLNEELFNPGFGDDIDFCCRVVNYGYQLERVGNITFNKDYYATDFPLNHKAESTVKDNVWWDWDSVSKKNKEVLKYFYKKRTCELNPKKSYGIFTVFTNLDTCRKFIDNLFNYTDFKGFDISLVYSVSSNESDAISNYIESLDSSIDAYLISDSYNESLDNILYCPLEFDYYVILTENCELLPQEKNNWLELLYYPFSVSEKVSISAPRFLYSNFLNIYYADTNCCMLHSKTLKDINWNSDYDSSYLMDLSLSYKIINNGNFISCIPSSISVVNKFKKDYVDIQFPISVVYKYFSSNYKSNSMIDFINKNGINNLKINLGCGTAQYSGYLNIDLDETSKYDIISGISDLSFLKDGSCSEIRALHVLEHINPFDLYKTFDEWIRILKPSGKIVIEVPNLRTCFEEFNKETDLFNKHQILTMVYGANELGPLYKHMYGYDETTLRAELSNKGLENIEFTDERISWNSHADYLSLHMECNKPMVYNHDDLLKYLGSFDEESILLVNLDDSDFIDSLNNNFKSVEYIDIKTIPKSELQDFISKFVSDNYFNKVIIDTENIIESLQIVINSLRPKLKHLGGIYGTNKNNDEKCKDLLRNCLGDPNIIFENGDWAFNVVKIVEVQTFNTGNIINNIMPSVTAVVCTKNRYFTTLSHTLMGIINQTYKPKQLLIYDDNGDENIDLRYNPLYKNILQLIGDFGIELYVSVSNGVGQVLNHDRSLKDAKYDWIWRLDDDNVPENNVLESLVNVVINNDKVGAVGGLVIDPLCNYKNKPPIASNNIEHIYWGLNIQWYEHETKDLILVDHLYSSFLYNKNAAIESGGYTKELPIGFREETILTYGLKRNNYNLFVIPNNITWHFNNPEGGMRPKDTSVFSTCEDIFRKKLKEWNINAKYLKLIVLDNGIGDHYCFKNIIPELKNKFEKTHDIIIACCYKDVFFDMPDLKLISISDARSIMGVDIDKLNIYAWCEEHSWKGSLLDAFRELYLH
jgi:GT2 family glycosyltransferase/predicted SAM-dependent methyltransferase